MTQCRKVGHPQADRAPTRSSRSGQGLNLNTAVIVASFVGTLVAGGWAGAWGVGKIVFVVTQKAEAINARFNGLEERVARAEGAAKEAREAATKATAAAIEAKAAAEAATREMRYKEELDTNREVRQLQGKRR